MTEKGFLLAGWQVSATLNGDSREFKQEGWEVGMEKA